MDLPQGLSEDASEEVDEGDEDMSLCNSHLSYISPQNASIVLGPSSSPKGNLAGHEQNEYLQSLQLQCLSCCQDEESSREGIASVIKELSQGRTGICPSCLLAVNRIES